MNNNEVEYFNEYCNDELKIDNNLTSILETRDMLALLISTNFQMLIKSSILNNI